MMNDAGHDTQCNTTKIKQKGSLKKSKYSKACIIDVLNIVILMEHVYSI